MSWHRALLLEGRPRPRSGPQATLSPKHCGRRGSFLPEGQRLPLPDLHISWPVHTSLTTSVWAGDAARSYCWT